MTDTTDTTDTKIHHCSSLAEVRTHIDALDTRIVALLAERSGYVRQAGRLKDKLEQIVDQPRIEAIIARVRSQAREHGAPEAVMEATYRAMIAAFIAFERDEFVRLHSERQE